MLEHIHWLGHDAFRIDSCPSCYGPQTIYFDPYELGEVHIEADVIFISHNHRDHCSAEDIAKIQGPDTVIVTVASAAAKLSGNVRVVKPGDIVNVKGIDVEAVPAYNVNKFRSSGEPFHPQEAGYVGFVVTLDDGPSGPRRIYHAGDTDHIPEMAGLKEIDIAFLPVSGVYVMTAEEAVQAAEVIDPKVAIPMHVGRGIGSREAAQTFKENAAVDVVILEIE